MSCAGFDVRDYFFGELPEAERAAAGRHVGECGQCALELEELAAMRGRLLSVREEEAPQRIGFVSDKVFEPSPLRRWLAGFWLSGARMGFASAAMLAAALLVLAARQPRVVEKRVEVPVAAAQAPADVRGAVDVKGAVAAALAEQALEQEKKTRTMMAELEGKHQMEERALALRVSEYLTNIDKRMGSERMVAYDFGNITGKQEKAQ